MNSSTTATPAVTTKNAPVTSPDQSSSTPSQPDSLDLDYDLWEGQFEFVGPGANDRRSPNGTLTADDSDDLNLRVNNNYIPPNQPILIDEETFLSLHPQDFESISGPQSGFFNSPVPAQRLSVEDKNMKNQKFLLNGSSGGGNGRTSSKMNDLKVDLRDNLNEQLEILQRQVTTLADSQNNVEDLKSRTKADYAVLQTRYHVLEEQLRETELRAEERLAEEQKRHRELLSRVEREAQLQNENIQIRLKTVEQEASNLRDEIQRLRMQADRQLSDLHNVEEKLEVARENLLMAQQDLAEARANERKYKADKENAEELLVEMGREVEKLRVEKSSVSPVVIKDTARIEELERELTDMKDKHRTLEEQNEELQALVLTRGVEQGISLINGTSNSLAKELEAMTQHQDQIDSATLESLTQLQLAYQDKEEENQRLKHYIDSILLNIVENYPQLLEVKSKTV